MIHFAYYRYEKCWYISNCDHRGFCNSKLYSLWPVHVFGSLPSDSKLAIWKVYSPNTCDGFSLNCSHVNLATHPKCFHMWLTTGTSEVANIPTDMKKINVVNTPFDINNIRPIFPMNHMWSNLIRKHRIPIKRNAVMDGNDNRSWSVVKNRYSHRFC